MCISKCKCLVFTFCLLVSVVSAQKNSSIEIWLTNPSANVLFKKQSAPLSLTNGESHQPVIIVDNKQTFQSMDGFGFSLTGGSAANLIKMTQRARATILKELFATDKNNIGINYLRISIGASDLNEKVFSYDDLPAGETDPDLKKFDLGPDKKDVIPILKEILKINPSIKIMGSPWSPPVWMKNNKDTRGGNLLPEYYGSYASYFIKYIHEMRRQGIRIDAVTVQNEPLHPGNNPSLQMLAPEQALFVRDYLGPAFKKTGITTKIIIYDHNADRPDYPISILDDTAARKFIDGSAFHLYGGKIEALSTVHAAHPDKNLYFTEQWIGAPGNFAGDIPWHIENLVIGASRNWCKTVLEWNLASNAQYQPHTDRGGCDKCLGAITIDQDRVTRNPAYYIIAHAAKFVRTGSLRIQSNLLPGLPNVAFKTPSGKMVLIVLNSSKEKKEFLIQHKGKNAKAQLLAGAVATYVW